MATAAAINPNLSDAPPLTGAARRAALRAVRIGGAAALVVAALVPVLPVTQGQSGSAVARIAAVLPGAPAPSEVQPLGASPTLAFAAAQPFVASYSDAASALRAETCLTEAIYYEGALEPETGQRAIAQVVLNRVRHPAYPNNVCGVVFQGQERSTGCQFTFTCDGSRARPPVASLWARANRIAKAALGGAVASEVGTATHYHADYVMPYWSSTLDQAGQIGRHIFYRWRGTPGLPGAFTDRYEGREPLIAAWTPRANAGGQAAGDLASAPPVLAASVTGDAGAVPGAAAAPAMPAAAPAPFRARPLTLAAKGGSQ